jgi:hypothetical protein
MVETNELILIEPTCPNDLRLGRDTGSRIVDQPEPSGRSSRKEINSEWMLILGGVSSAIPQPIFEQAAKQRLAQTGRAHCRLVGGYPIDRMYNEFNVACDPPSVARR